MGGSFVLQSYQDLKNVLNTEVSPANVSPAYFFIFAQKIYIHIADNSFDQNKKFHCRSSLYFLLVELDFSYAYFNSVTFCVDFLCLWSSIYNVSLSKTFTFVKSTRKAVNSTPNSGDFQRYKYGCISNGD